jgi:maltooligosyltrehalose trehalohydrolase
LRYFGAPNAGGEKGGESADRLLIVNVGLDITLDPAPEPLLAAPPGHAWQIMITTEDPAYGGSGTAPVETELEGWHIPGRTAVVLRPAAAPVQTRHRVAGSAQEAKKKQNPPQ